MSQDKLLPRELLKGSELIGTAKDAASSAKREGWYQFWSLPPEESNKNESFIMTVAPMVHKVSFDLTGGAFIQTDREISDTLSGGPRRLEFVDSYSHTHVTTLQICGSRRMPPAIPEEWHLPNKDKPTNVPGEDEYGPSWEEEDTYQILHLKPLESISLRDLHPKAFRSINEVQKDHPIWSSISPDSKLRGSDHMLKTALCVSQNPWRRDTFDFNRCQVELHFTTEHPGASFSGGSYNC